MLLALPEAVGEALVDAGVVDDIVEWPDGVGQANLILVGSGMGARELRRAAVSLPADGILYVERTRTTDMRRGLWAARRAARLAGLTEFGRWAALPELHEPRRFLPLDHRGALRWYFQYNFLAGSLATRAGRVVLIAAATVPRLIERTVPASVLVATRGPRNDPLPDYGVPGLAARQRAVITSGHDLGSRSVVLPFEPNSAWPEVVMKVATRGNFGDTTRNEHDRLEDLRRRLPPRLAIALPTPLASFELSGLAATAQETARGPTLWARSGRWPRRQKIAVDDLNLVTSWLIGFGLATSLPGPADPAVTWLETPLADLKSMSPVSDMVVRLVTSASIQLRAAKPMVSMVQHYDMGPWNIVRVEMGLKVLDWELDRLSGRDGLGPPMTDLLYFVASWHSLARGMRSSDGQVLDLVELFSDTPRRCWQTRWAVGALGRYAEEVGVPRSTTRALLVALWLERAVTSLRRWHRIGASAAWDDTPLRYLEALAHG